MYAISEGAIYPPVTGNMFLHRKHGRSLLWFPSPISSVCCLALRFNFASWSICRLYQFSQLVSVCVVGSQKPFITCRSPQEAQSSSPSASSSSSYSRSSSSSSNGSMARCFPLPFAIGSDESSDSSKASPARLLPLPFSETS